MSATPRDLLAKAVLTGTRIDLLDQSSIDVYVDGHEAEPERHRARAEADPAVSQPAPGRRGGTDADRGPVAPHAVSAARAHGHHRAAIQRAAHPARRPD